MLVYIGDGRFLPDIPARDLSDDEVKNHGGEKKLVESGLYAKPKREAAEKEKLGG